jgi:quercetin dioxygenase-like cupin family protein
MAERAASAAGVEGYEQVAHHDPSPLGADQGSERTFRQQLIVPRPGSPLSLEVVTLDSGTELRLGADPDRHELAYLLDGMVDLTRDSERISIAPDTAFLSTASHPTSVRSQGPARLAVFSAGPACDEHASLGEHADHVQLDLGNADHATGKRSFQVLLGPENNCCRATMFVGVVPPGAAPWHFHQYDEIVYLLDGEANYRQAHGDQPMGPGSAVRIPPRTVHINANTSADQMRVLGVFTPAGSPAAAYLADEPRSS